MASERKDIPYDRLVGSFTTHLFALVSLSIAYVLLAVSFASRIDAIVQLRGLDKLLAIREAVFSKASGVQFTKRDLRYYFEKAADDASAPTADGIDPYYTHILDSRGFTEEAVDKAFILQVSSRLVQRSCEFVRIDLVGAEIIHYVTFQIIGKTYQSKISDVTLGVLDRCFDGEREFIVLKSGGDVVLALPKTIEDEFNPLTPPPPFKSFPFREQQKIIDALPPEVAKYVSLPDDMVTIHLRAIEHYILAHATRRHGKFYAPSEFDQAVTSLYDEREAQTILFGMSAKPSLLIELGPLFLFVLSFEIWRRVRRIPIRSESGAFWFATDTKDRLGRMTARVYSFLPVMCTIVFIVAYIYALRPSIIGIDDVQRALRISRLEGVGLREALVWLPISFVATVTLLLVPLQIWMTIATTRRLLKISSISSRNPHGRSTKMVAVRKSALKRRFKR